MAQALTIIREIFAHPAFQGKFLFKYVRRTNQAGEEVFGSLENGLWWKQKQVKIESNLKEAVVDFFLSSSSSSSPALRSLKSLRMGL